MRLGGRGVACGNAGRDSCTLNYRARPDLDDRLRRNSGLADFVVLVLAVVREPCQFVVHGLVARGIGPANDLLKPVEVLKERRIQFEFEVAGGASRAVIRLADLPVGADVEPEHGVSSCWVWGLVGVVAKVEGGNESVSAFLIASQPGEIPVAEKSPPPC